VASEPLHRGAEINSGTDLLPPKRSYACLRCTTVQQPRAHDYLSPSTQGLGVTTYLVRQRLSDDADLFLDSLRDIVGAAHVLTDPARAHSYFTDWTGRWER
jgi:hypothetical protein